MADVTSETSDPVLGNNVVTEGTTVTVVHDIAVLKIHVPNQVTLQGVKASSTERVRVQIQNRSPHDETIANAAMLGTCGSR